MLVKIKTHFLMTPVNGQKQTVEKRFNRSIITLIVYLWENIIDTSKYVGCYFNDK